VNTFQVGKLNVSDRLKYLKERIEQIHCLKRLISDGMPVAVNKTDKMILSKVGKRIFKSDPNYEEKIQDELLKMIEEDIGEDWDPLLDESACIVEKTNVSIPTEEMPITPTRRNSQEHNT
jgi:hypothetical protein